MNIEIDPEFKSLIPPLREEEYKQLEENIKKEGVHESIKVWNNILIDGHNRYEICKKYNISFVTVEKTDLKTRDDVKEWIIRNQLGRRNLNPSDYLALMYKLSEIKNKNIIEESKKKVVEKLLKKGKEIRNKPITEEEKETRREIKKEEKVEANKREIESIKNTEKENPTPINERHIIINDDFRNVKLEKNSIDIILTDPPYPKEYLPLWKDLSEFANKVLKPSGFLIAYSGEMYLPEVIESLKTYLNYYWCMSLQHTGNTQIVNGRNIQCGWKPILMFQKSPFKLLNTFPKDVITGTGRDKDLHEWQQSAKEIIPLIEKLTKENDIILDPFAGSGSIMEAAELTKRKSISIEINSDYIDIIKQRLKK